MRAIDVFIPLLCLTLASQVAAAAPARPTKAVGAKPAAPKSLQPFALDSLKGTHLDIKAVDLPLPLVVRALEKAAVGTKGEFETTAEYEGRQAAFATAPFLGMLTPESLMAFSVPGPDGLYKVEYAYDADLGTVTIPFRTYRTNPNGIAQGAIHTSDRRYREGIEVVHVFLTTIASKSYIGSNAYGATARVTKNDFNLFGIALHPNVVTESLAPTYGKRPATTFAMSAEKAKRELPHLRMAIIVRPKEPYVLYHYDRDKATISSPRESVTYEAHLLGHLHGIVYYSGLSGEIFARVPEQFGMDIRQPEAPAS